jgi:hypothetical protein
MREIVLGEDPMWGENRSENGNYLIEIGLEVKSVCGGKSSRERNTARKNPC